MIKIGFCKNEDVYFIELWADFYTEGIEICFARSNILENYVYCFITNRKLLKIGEGFSNILVYFTLL